MEHRSSGSSGQARQAARELVLNVDRSEENDGWMLSYLDLLTLLLVLFVLLLAMRGVIPQDASSAPATPMASNTTVVMVSPLALAAADRISPVQAIPASTIGVLPWLVASPAPQMPWQMLPATEQRAPARVDVQAALAVMIPLMKETAPVEASATPADEVMAMDHRLAGIEGVQVTRERERTILRIEDRLLFPSADVDIGGQGSVLLDRLLPALRDFDGEISVEGHTDSRTISTDRFPSNWELSAGRATAVLRYLSRGGVSSAQLRAIGYGLTRPLAANNSDAGRAQNRRVELVLSPAGTRPPTP